MVAVLVMDVCRHVRSQDGVGKGPVDAYFQSTVGRFDFSISL